MFCFVFLAQKTVYLNPINSLSVFTTTIFVAFSNEFIAVRILLGRGDNNGFFCFGGTSRGFTPVCPLITTR